MRSSACPTAQQSLLMTSTFSEAISSRPTTLMKTSTIRWTRWGWMRHRRLNSFWIIRRFGLTLRVRKPNAWIPEMSKNWTCARSKFGHILFGFQAILIGTLRFRAIFVRNIWNLSHGSKTKHFASEHILTIQKLNVFSIQIPTVQYFRKHINLVSNKTSKDWTRVIWFWLKLNAWSKFHF